MEKIICRIKFVCFVCAHFFPPPHNIIAVVVAAAADVVVVIIFPAFGNCLQVCAVLCFVCLRLLFYRPSSEKCSELWWVHCTWINIVSFASDDSGGGGGGGWLRERERERVTAKANSLNFVINGFFCIFSFFLSMSHGRRRRCRQVVETDILTHIAYAQNGIKLIFFVLLCLSAVAITGERQIKQKRNGKT